MSTPAPIHAVSGHFTGQPTEIGLRQWAESLRQSLTAGPATLGLIFITPEYFDEAPEILEAVRVHARIQCLAGCSSRGLIRDGEELEDQPGIVLGLYHLPGASICCLQVPPESEAVPLPSVLSASGLHSGAATVRGWLAFADPYTMNIEKWLSALDADGEPLPVFGGLASGNAGDHSTRICLNGQVFESGAVLVGIGGSIEIEGVISQGCTPIGESWTITKARQNLVQEIGNRPAYDILVETFQGLPEAEREKSRGNVFAGLVINEYLDEFHRGDFLVRNIVGRDSDTGALVVGAWPRPGQTLQFQRRDAEAATEDMVDLFDRKRAQLAGRRIYGAALCSCNGRGRELFGYPNHDAGMVQRYFGPLGVCGFFCNGELGPVGRRNFVHGFTAVVALFAERAAQPTSSSDNLR